MTLPLFDQQTSLALRDVGMNRAAGNKNELLMRYRAEAVRLAQKFGAITADDVSEAMYIKYNIDPSELGNASGSIFKGGQFVPTGKYVQARRAMSHGRRIAEWRLK